MYDYEYENDVLLFLRLLKFLHTEHPFVLEQIIKDYPTADEEDIWMILDELLMAVFDEGAPDEGDDMMTVRFSDERIDRLYTQGCTPKIMGDSQDQLSTTREAPLISKSNTTVAIEAIPAKPLMIPFVTWVNFSLLAIWLIFVRIGAKIDSALFCMEVQICAQVLGILENLVSMSSAAANMAFFTTSAVIWPSEAICRISPMETPK